jgi:hypothetical protein
VLNILEEEEEEKEKEEEENYNYYISINYHIYKNSKLLNSRDRLPKDY